MVFKTGSDKQYLEHRCNGLIYDIRSIGSVVWIDECNSGARSVYGSAFCDCIINQ